MAQPKSLIVGGIFAHGCRSPDDTYVVIPERFFLVPLVADNDNLQWQKQIGAIDLDVIETREGRSCINSDFFSTKPYMPGFVLKNVLLNFRVVFDNQLCHTTGIITTGKIHNHLLKRSNFASETEMQTELMKTHDETIAKTKDVWAKDMHLGNVIKKIEVAGKSGGYLGVFCRGPADDHTEYIPSFLTVKMIDQIYYSNFFTKLAELETCAQTRVFTGYSITGLLESKLFMRVTFHEICTTIRNKLNVNNTINSFDFHSVIEIYHSKQIPIECVQFALYAKFNRLITRLSLLLVPAIIIEAVTDDAAKIKFKTILSLLCRKFQANLDRYIVHYQNQTQIIIFVSEKLTAGLQVSHKFYDEILAYGTAFKVENTGFALKF